MMSLVEKELDRLQELKIIEPVEYSDWAAPIIPVLKSDKASVRICGDFSTTVNKASPLDRYPIPKIEDLFATLHRGKQFTKLDMSQAYQKILIDEESRKLLTINTHRGLFRYNRLPFGVSSAPGIFQRTMETLLKGIPNLIVYIVSAARSLTCRDDLDSKWRLLLAENELSRVSLLSSISIGN